MASVKAIQEQERLKKEARRAAAAESLKLEAEAQAAEEARRQRRSELHRSIALAIDDGREEDAINFIQRDKEADAELLCRADDKKRNVLHRAAAHGLLDCCTVILQKDDVVKDIHVILDAKDDAGCTPLHLAAMMNYASVCVHLLEAKCDAVATDHRGWTARDYAHQYGLFEPSEALQEATLAAQLEIAAEARRKAEEAEAARLAAIKPPDLRDRRALLIGLKEQRLDDCMTVLGNDQWLYTNEVEKERGRNALHLAAEKGYVDICRALLARPDFRTAGAFDKDLSTALHYAVGNRCVETSLAIIESNNFNAIDKVNIRDQTALSLAAQRGDVVVCLAILQRMSVEALQIVDRKRRRALDYAEDNELFDVVTAIRRAMGDKV